MVGGVSVRISRGEFTSPDAGVKQPLRKAERRSALQNADPTLAGSALQFFRINSHLPAWAVYTGRCPLGRTWWPLWQAVTTTHIKVLNHE
jgi:hypothetical protein